MNKRTVLIALGVCALLGLIGAGVLGWLWINRDRAAVASYRVELSEGQSFSDVLEGERELILSEDVLRPVIGDLDLVKRWKMKSEDAAFERMKSKLKVKSTMGDYVRVVYRDRNQERALEILDAINRRFAKARYLRAQSGSMPPIVPPETKVGDLPPPAANP